ncbi:MAG: hypothetical protein V4654_00515 [Bdellovibrionota bacterium]
MKIFFTAMLLVVASSFAQANKGGSDVGSSHIAFSIQELNSSVSEIQSISCNRTNVNYYELLDQVVPLTNKIESQALYLILDASEGKYAQLRRQVLGVSLTARNFWVIAFKKRSNNQVEPELLQSMCAFGKHKL